MPELEQVNPEQTNDTDLLKVIEQLQSTTVSKDKYDQLLAEKSQLAQAIANGARVSSTANDDTTVSAEELAQKLLAQGETAPEMSNLEYIQTALKLRETILADKGVDIFLPKGHDYVVTDADVAASNRVVETLEECIELSGGDNTVFTAQLQSRLVDMPIPRRK